MNDDTSRSVLRQYTGIDPDALPLGAAVLMKFRSGGEVPGIVKTCYPHRVTLAYINGRGECVSSSWEPKDLIPDGDRPPYVTLSVLAVRLDD